MAEHSVEPQVAAGLKMISPYLPGLAGAVLALALDDKTKLTLRGRAVKVVGGMVCAAFLGPALALVVDLWWPGALPSEVSGAIVFATGLIAMRALPPLLGWVAKIAGDPLKLLPIQFVTPAANAQDVLVGDPSVPAPSANGQE